MNDIASIQKLNSMSQELRNFGFADSSVSSVQQAANIMLSEEAQKSSIFGRDSELFEELNNKFHRFKDFSDNRILKLSQEVGELKSQVKELIGVISVIKSRPASTHQPSPEPLLREQPREKEESVNKTQVVSVEKEKPYYEKQGHYSPDNVKIEDFFYFGNK
ncbi:MAG: hypothetical protein ABIC91_02320 [Nanoarchaeota archaeon]|nr:hypothetical protein [Nanoarchaeota archaeon]MBU1030127.1 hypothetical protein [Nanoarchaeota archaeon]MBU1850635.1 hypothetical protein [Nanoarchaeota archaeon]